VHSSRTDRTKRSACGFAVRAARGNLGHGDVLPCEDGIECGGALGVAVTDEVGELDCVGAELLQELSGLLGCIGGGGVGGDAEDVNGAGADLHDEQGVETLQCDGVHVEEVCGEEAAGLGFEERRPLASGRVVSRCGSAAGLTQDAADRWLR
jgi:hypothetical protein